MGADAQNRYRISLAPPPPLEIRSAPPLRKPKASPSSLTKEDLVNTRVTKSQKGGRVGKTHEGSLSFPNCIACRLLIVLPIISIYTQILSTSPPAALT